VKTEGKIYTTETGVELRIGRIPRQSIDRFVAEHRPPEPPMITVETWAGDVEEMPDHDAPEYQRAMGQYWLRMGKEHVALIADAVTVLSDTRLSELAELREVGLVTAESDSVADFLRYIVSDADTKEIVGVVLYNSTVTDRGLLEASVRFNVSWRGKRVSALSVLGDSPGRYGPEFEARRAAQFCGLPWRHFCKLGGPAQSSVVAFFRLNNSLAWLQSKRRGK